MVNKSNIEDMFLAIKKKEAEFIVAGLKILLKEAKAEEAEEIKQIKNKFESELEDLKIINS